MYSNLFVLKEAYHSEKMEGVIPADMTFEQYVVAAVAHKQRESKG